MLAIEYGDDVGKDEVTVNKAVGPGRLRSRRRIKPGGDQGCVDSRNRGGTGGRTVVEAKFERLLLYLVVDGDCGWELRVRLPAERVGGVYRRKEVGD